MRNRRTKTAIRSSGVWRDYYKHVDARRRYANPTDEGLACSGPERLGHFMDRSMMALRDGSHMYTPPNAPGATRSVQDMARPAHLWHLTRLQL